MSSKIVPLVRTLGAVLVKPFPDAKQRLAPAMSASTRHAVARAMLGDVLASLRRVRSIQAVAVVTCSTEVEAVALRSGAAVVREAAASGQSAAAVAAIHAAQAARFQRVVLLPGDVPLLDSLELGTLLDQAEEDRVAVTVVPDRHVRGTNCLVLAPPDAIAPSFGPGSLERHLAAAPGWSRRVGRAESLELDVDTVDDVSRLRLILSVRPAAAPRTRRAFKLASRRRSAAAAHA